MSKDTEIKYTEIEQKILAVLTERPNEEFTLAELSTLVGVELKSGHINALVNKKGRVDCHKDAREVEYVAKKKVSTYSLVR